MEHVAVMFKLDYPDKMLSPNKRGNWRVKQPAKIRAKEAAFLTALEGNSKHVVETLFPKDGKVVVTYIFHQSDHRKRDLDNMIAAMKAAQDGVFRALGIDDGKIDLVIGMRGKNADPPYVDMILRPYKDNDNGYNPG